MASNVDAKFSAVQALSILIRRTLIESANNLLHAVTQVKPPRFRYLENTSYSQLL